MKPIVTMEALEQALGPVVQPEAKKAVMPKAPVKELIIEEEPLMLSSPLKLALRRFRRVRRHHPLAGLTQTWTGLDPSSTVKDSKGG